MGDFLKNHWIYTYSWMVAIYLSVYIGDIFHLSIFNFFLIFKVKNSLDICFLKLKDHLIFGWWQATHLLVNGLFFSLTYFSTGSIQEAFYHHGEQQLHLFELNKIFPPV